MSAVDQGILDFFVHHRVETLTPVVTVFTILTGPTLVWFYSIVVAVLVRKIWLPIAVGTANLASHVVKRLVDRPRPDATHHLVDETNASMPSGHSVGAAAFAMAITLLVRRWWTIMLWVLALLVGLSRLYVGVHWPSDLLAGWVMGAFIVWAVYIIAVRASRYRPRGVNVAGARIGLRRDQ